LISLRADVVDVVVISLKVSKVLVEDALAITAMMRANSERIGEDKRKNVTRCVTKIARCLTSFTALAAILC